MTPQFDAKDQSMLNERMALRRTLQGPQVGDFVLFPDGHSERVSHDWGDSYQTSHGGSFHLCASGHGGFSGSLNSAIAKKHFKVTEKTMDGSFWFFHHGQWRAHNGVDVQVPCPVYECDVLRRNDFDDSFKL